ncbi:tape measure protein [Psychrobacter pygoscelis]|uniref:tape measure protein n=1 Tax=Psychrobacter pygoscelis TaxID=2488563 RepID=UPI00103A5FBC|nr:tape measure protein [Psychrobacter pygoscelis]
MANQLDFSVRLQMLTDSFNQNVREAGDRFSQMTRTISQRVESMNADTSRAADLLGRLGNVDTNTLTSEIEQAAQQLRSMGSGAQLTQEQIDAAMRQSALHTERLAQQLRVAKQEVERLGSTSATPAQLAEAAAKVDNLTARVAEARLKVEQLSSTNGTPAQIEEAKAKVDRLGASITEARQEIVQMSQTRGTPEDIDSAKGKVDNLSSSLAEARARVKQLSQTRGTPEQIDAAKAKVDSLSNAVDEARLNVERLSRTNGTPADIIEAKGRIDSVSLSLDEARLKVERLSRTNGTPDQIVEAKNKVDNLAASITEAKSKVEQLSRTVGTPQDIAEAKNRVNDFGLSIDAAKAKVKELSQTKGTPEDIENAKAKIASLKDELSAAKLAVKSLRDSDASPQDIEAAQNKVRALTSYIEGTRDEVKRLRETKGTPEDIANAKNEVNNLSLSLAEARDHVKLLSQTRGTPEDIAEAKNQVNALSRSLADAKNEVRQLSDTSASPADIATAKAKVEELKATLDATREEVRHLSQTSATPEDIAEARAKVTALSQDLNEARTEARELNQTSGSPAELLEAKAKVNQLKESLNSAREEVRQLSQTNASPADIAEAKARVAALKAELGEARTEARTLSQTSATPADIAEARAAANALEQELEQAKQAALDLSRTGASPAELAEAAERVQRLEQELGRASRASTDLANEMSRAMNRASDTAEAARNAIYRMTNTRLPDTVTNQINEMRRALTEFQNDSTRPAEEIRRITRITEEQIQRLEQELRGLDDQIDRTTQETHSFTGGISGVRNAIGSLQGMLAAAGLGIGVAEIIETSDAFKTLEARIKLATGEGAAFVTAFEGVKRIANETFSSIENTGELFARVTQSAEALGLAQSEVLGITQSINQAIKLSGGSAASADAAITQLIQGLQSGVVRGEEFNSIMEQAPRLAQAMAAGLGVTRGELRAMAADGKLTSEVVLRAVQSQADVITKEFDSLPITVGNAVAVMKNKLFDFIGNMDKTVDQSSKLAEAINSISSAMENMDPTTIDAINQTFNQLMTTVGSLWRTIADTYNGINEWIGILTNSADVASEKVGIITRTMQGVSIVLGTINDGLAAISIASNVVEGSISAWLSTLTLGLSKVTFGELSADLEAFAQRLAKNSSESYKKAEDAAMSFKSAAKAALDDAAKSNQDRLNEVAESATAAYQQMSQDGQASAEALEGAFAEMAKAQVKAHGEGALASLQALGAEQNLKVAIDETGKAIVEKMSDNEIAAASAETTAKNIDAAYSKLADTVGVGLSEGYREAKAAVLELSKNFDILSESGYQAGEVMVAALGDMVKKAKNTDELQDVISIWEDLGEQGRLTGEDLAAGLDLANERLDALTEGVNSVNEAYKLLGLTTRKEAAKQAEVYNQAYSMIVKDGEATAGQLIEAFKKTAKAQIAANGDVIDATTRAQAAQRGLTVSVDETGRVSFESMSKAARATNDAKPPVDRVKNSMFELSSAAGKAGNSMKNAADKAYRSYDKLKSKIDELKTAQAQLDAERKARNSAPESNQFGTKQGVEGFLKSAGLSSDEAAEQARKLYAKSGKRDGALNFGQLQGFRDGQRLSISDLQNFKTASQYLSDIAQREKVRQKSRLNGGKRDTDDDDSNKESSRRESNPAPYDSEEQKQQALRLYNKKLENLIEAKQKGASADDLRDYKEVLDNAANMLKELGVAVPQQQVLFDKIAQRTMSLSTPTLPEQTPQKTVQIEIKQGSKRINATVPENQENDWIDFAKKLGESRALAGY